MGVIRISCVGDLLPADTAYSMGNGIGSKMGNLIEHYSNNRNNPFINSDIVFCNLEAPLITKSGGAGKPFEGNPDVLQLLRILNISVVSIANNHILDHGREGLEMTTSLLEKSGFLPIGQKKGDISKIAITERQGKKIAFAAFNAIKDHTEDNLISQVESDLLMNTLHEIKKLAPDLIIFSLHWGNEYVIWPSPSQIGLAHKLIGNGVNIIIGHHPHVVQPVEKYNGGIIIYSLGNFLFDMFWSKKVRTGILVDLILQDNKSIDYQVKNYMIKPDFTLDFINDTGIRSGLSKRDKSSGTLMTGSREEAEKKYLRECKTRRLESRLLMKLYILRNFFRLSRPSRLYLMRNIKMKSGFSWKRN